jgi:predicted DNA-binding transcriptional regulator AlpA
MNIETLPPRIPASTVCKLAGYSKATLMKRIKREVMPKPVDRGREKLFKTAEVLAALGLTDSAPAKGVDPWEAALKK